MLSPDQISQLQSAKGNGVATNQPMDSASFAQWAQPTPPQSSKDDLLNNPITRGIQNIFPGKQVGEAIGTLGGLGITAGKEALGLGPKGSTKAYDTSAPSPLQVAGDIGQGALTVAAPEIGSGGTALGRIGANAALGAGLGGTGAIAQGKDIGEVAKDTAIGGAIGGGTSAVGEGISSLMKNLPNWFVQKALPKLNPENTDFALKNMNIKGIKSNSKIAEQAVNSYGNTISSILSHPQYAEETGAIQNILPKVTQELPNAGLDNSQIIDSLKSIAPKQSTLIDKLANGTANINEQNILRQELDKNIYPSIADKINPKISFDKSIGKIVTDSLRSNVQTTAPETKPIFEQFSKEINLSNALKFAKAKIEKGSPISLYDIVSGVGGGIPGVVAERAARTPSVLIGAAKAIAGAAKAEPILSAVGKGIKAPLIKAITD